MSSLTTPDGCRINYERRGEGPPVVLLLGMLTEPAVYEGLIADLARDHTVTTFDPRGSGASDRRGPYDPETDADDFEAVCEASAPPVVAVAVANGMYAAVRVGARRPDIVSAVVSPGGNPLGRAASRDSAALAGSQSVIDLTVTQARTDHRGVLRTLISGLNSQLDEDAIRERVERGVEYMGHEAFATRLEHFTTDQTIEEARQMGDRLRILHYPTNWFTADTIDPLRAELPEVQVELVENGPLSRPDFTANAVRQLTGVRVPA